VEVALDVIARGERDMNEDGFVSAVLAQVAERNKNNDFDGAVQALDNALVQLDRQEARYRKAARRRRVAILEAGVRQHTLRRDAVAVAGRIEMLVAVDQPTKRPAWLPAFRERYDASYEDGEAKGINFSLSVAIELAWRMVATAHDGTERGTAANLLGIALWSLGERESGTKRLEEAVAAYRAALLEYTRERVPLDWAMTQNNLGTALQTLGERKEQPKLLGEALEAIKAGREVYLDAGMIQYEAYFADWIEALEAEIAAVQMR